MTDNNMLIHSNVPDRDRDLLNDNGFQIFWTNVYETSLKLNQGPWRRFVDTTGRKFSIFISNISLVEKDTTELDQQDEDMVAEGFTRLYMFGALDDTNHLCFATFGLYISDELDYVTEKVLETDMYHRRKRLGYHVFSAAMESATKFGKAFKGSGNDTIAGQVFKRSVENLSAPKWL